jgi:PAS domain S-box-containing protein
MSEDKESKDLHLDSSEVYTSLIDTSPDAIITTDVKGRILMANQQAVVIFGFDGISDLIGRNALEFIPPLELEQVKEDIKRFLKAGGVKSIDYTLVRKDGSTFSGNISASVIPGHEGNPGVHSSHTRCLRAQVC